MVSLFLTLLATTATIAAPKSLAERPSKEGLAFFEKKIRPVLVHNCYECHSGDAAKAKGHLLLDSAEGIQKGEIIGRIHVCQRLLKLPLTPTDELLAKAADELRALATTLEQKLGLVE